MLSSSKRLSSAEVKRVMARGQGRRGKFLSLKLYKVEEPFRCAVVVSKKISGSAVARNALRRSVYQALGAISLPHAGHAILFVQSVPRQNSQETFTSEIKTLLNV
ncbi:MAG TPA: ribonuclease P protein component [Candidatus Paceibacterota bacterium]|nr:ribonuclease P protein component [Candidatus Paceibacterota bacterium]